MKFSLVIFWEKLSFGAIWSFYTIFYCLIGHGRNWARPLLLLGLKHSGHDFFNSQDMLGSLNSQEMISQVNIYVTNIAWILCYFYLFRSEFNRGSDGFVKIL